MILVPWGAHSPESRELAESLRAALEQRHGSEKAAALALGLTPSQLSRQLAGTDPFNLWRAADPALVVTFMKIHSAKVGAAFLTPEEKSFVLGFIGMGRARMARFFAMEHASKKVSA